MSWSVSACGPASKIAEQLEQQFSKINLTDPGEQETVQHVRALVAQTLTTIDPEKAVQVSASGSMGSSRRFVERGYLEPLARTEGRSAGPEAEKSANK